MAETFDISAAFNYGLDRLATRGGAVLVGVYVLYQIVAQIAFQSLFVRLAADSPSADQLDQLYPLAIDVPITVSGVGILVLMLGGLVLSVVATRALYSNIDRIPTADHTRRLARTVAVAFVVLVIYTLIVMIGTIFFIVPGIFLAVSFVFAQPAVILEDVGVLESFKRSWGLASGNRLQLFGLGVLVTILCGIVGGVIGFVGVFVPLFGEYAVFAVTGAASIFGLAVLVGVYQQLVPAARSGAGSDVDSGVGTRL